jgi:pimeloyl-ACP methyl ester carboxylesterase
VRQRDPDSSSRTWDCFRIRFDSDDEFTQGQEGLPAIIYNFSFWFDPLAKRGSLPSDLIRSAFRSTRPNLSRETMEESTMRIVCSALVLMASVLVTAQNPSTVNRPLRAQAQVLGTGDPVVLLGGGLLGADGWGGVPGVLAKTHRVINVQSLAVEYGLESRPLPNGYSLRTEAEVLRTTLDALAVQRADLIGMSHGGVTALLVRPRQSGPRAHAHRDRATRILGVAEPRVRRPGGARDAAVPEHAPRRHDYRATRRAVSVLARRLRSRPLAATSIAVEAVDEMSQLTPGVTHDQRLHRRFGAAAEPVGAHVSDSRICDRVVPPRD